MMNKKVFRQRIKFLLLRIKDLIITSYHCCLRKCHESSFIQIVLLAF